MARLRRIATWTLLTFVVFTAGYAVGKEVGVRKVLARMPEPAVTPRAAGSSDVESGVAEPTRELVAWYFHSTKRCKKCNTIEAYAQETLDARFADEMAAGTIRWQTANMDDVWNTDAVRRYGLVRSSFVLVDMLDGEERKFTVLNRTWELTDSKDTFLDYVESEVEMILDSRTEDDEAEE